MSSTRLDTNYVPSDDEVQDIRQYLCDPKDRLSRLDSEITRMQAALDDLRDERDKLGAHIKSHHTLISPVRRLPQDIWREIFVACLPSDRNAVMSAKEAPVLLGQVCSAWRDVSHSTPRLWSTIHIPIPVGFRNINKLQERHETVKTWLSRSGACPLSISLQSPEARFSDVIFDRTKPQLEVLQAVIKTLRSFSKRWRHVYVDLPNPQFSMLSDISQHDVPLLETIKVVCRGWGFNWSHMNVLQAPRLRILNIDCINGDFFNIPIHWSNLTELAIQNMKDDQGITFDYVLILARACPNLVTCRLTIYDESGENMSRKPATFPHLQTLFIVDICDATILFNLLTMPSLRHVKFEAWNPPVDRPMSLLALLSRATHIESLAFEWVQGRSKEDLLRCLDLVPHVTMLDVFIHRYGQWSQSAVPPTMLDDAMLERCLPSSDGCLLPKLESLNFRNASFSEALLLKVIGARTNVSDIMHSSVASLRNVHVSFDHPRMVDISTEFQRLTALGVNISLKYLNSPVLDPWIGLPKTESRILQSHSLGL